MSPASAKHAQLAILLALAGAAVLFAVLRSPAFPLLVSPGAAEWIGSPIRIETNAIPIHPDKLPTARFARSFELPDGGPLQIHITALRGYELRLNGEQIASRSHSEGNWKLEETVEVTTGLEASNTIHVVVRNDSGPALLRLSATAPGFELNTDARWAAVDSRGRTRPALVADDTRSGAIGLGVPTSWQLITKHRDALIGFATICGLLSIAFGRRRLPSPHLLPALACAIALGLWSVVLLRKGMQLPAFVGFDGPAHIEYVRFLLDNGKLPLPEDGFSMYHPPLFYGIGALLVSLFGGGAGADDLARESAEAAMRGLTFLAGLAQIAIAFGLSRRLFPGDSLRQALSMLICALLPVNLYMSMYVSNEPLNAALAGWVVLLTTDLLLREGLPLARVIGLAAVLGLALLTKATSLLLLPLVGIGLGLKHLALDRAGLGSTALRALLGTLALSLVSGWYFVRNLVSIGTPTVGNWNVTYNDVGWFQLPGFHTPAYYLRFGDSISRPFFGGFHSFWDGIYSTFWGDGLVAGVVELSQRHPLWNYEFMSIGYVLALPATMAILAGVAAFAFSRERDERRKLALTFLAVAIFAYGGAVLVMTLRLPFYAQAKASYALSVIAPLSLAGAHALALLHERLAEPSLRWLQVLLHAFCGALAIVLALAFCG